MAKVYRPTKEERDATKERMAEAKAQGMSFDDFFAQLQEQLPELKKATAYGWWQSAGEDSEPTSQTAKGKTGQSKTNPSEQLANLLRKEGVLQNRLVKAREELAAVQSEIRNLWDEREKQIAQSLSEDL
jgi:predicted  nucleic acid-binding Zn-ribbon protein